MRILFLIGLWSLPIFVIGQDIVPFKQDMDSFWENEKDSLGSPENPFWRLQGKVYLNMTQGAQFNWAKGGDNIFSSLSKTELKAKYKKGKQIWDNRLNWNYGFIFIGVPQDKTVQYRTSDDNIELNSSFGYRAGGHFYYNGLLNFKTQFLPGYKYPNKEDKVSNFLSPAYVIFSIGMNYKPSELLKVMVSPITSKTTLVVREGEVDETKYGLEEGERIYREIGAYLSFYNKIKLYQDIDVENRLTLFSNYDKNPENIDVELKSDFSFKINKYVKATVSFHFIYDDDASIPVETYRDGLLQKTTYTKGLQFQEKIMIGIGYEF